MGQNNPAQHRSGIVEEGVGREMQIAVVAACLLHHRLLGFPICFQYRVRKRFQNGFRFGACIRKGAKTARARIEAACRCVTARRGLSGLSKVRVRHHQQRRLRLRSARALTHVERGFDFRGAVSIRQRVALPQEPRLRRCSFGGRGGE